MAPQARFSVVRKPKPTVTTISLSMGTIKPSIYSPGGSTCGVTTHSSVISPKTQVVR